MNVVLWVIQVLLALLFLFAGGTKFVFSIEQMRAMGPPNQVLLPGLLIHFIGVCEILGALALILPRLLRVRPGPTPPAAAGLAIIMIGATVITIAGPSASAAPLPFPT